MSTQETRLAVIAEARTWLGTNFHHAACLKGVGVDCVNFPAATYRAALGAHFDIPFYSAQWHLHEAATEDQVGPKFEQFPEYNPVGALWVKGRSRFRELYLEGLLRSDFIEIAGGQKDIEPFDSGLFLDVPFGPGDLVVAKLARTFAHGAIIIDWPKIIQAESAPAGAGKVVVSNTEANWYFTARDLRFFSWKGWH